MGNKRSLLLLTKINCSKIAEISRALASGQRLIRIYYARCPVLLRIHHQLNYRENGKCFHFSVVINFPRLIKSDKVRRSPKIRQNASSLFTFLFMIHERITNEQEVIRTTHQKYRLPSDCFFPHFAIISIIYMEIEFSKIIICLNATSAEWNL